MIKASSSLQDLRRRLYVKAKAESSWCFWGLYVHVCKRETLWEAYRLAKRNNGAPGIDGVTFEAVEAEGVEGFLDQLRKELEQRAMRLGRSPAGVATGSVAERAIDVFALASVAGIGALLLPRELDPQSRNVFLGLTILVAVIGLAVVGVVLTLGRAPFRLKRTIARVRSALRVAAKRPERIAIAFVLGIVLQTLLVSLNAWLGRECGLDLPVTAWLFAWPLAKISALLPVSQGGLGVREAALAALLKPLGTPVAMSVAAGLIFQAVILSGGLLGGALALLLGRTKPKTVERRAAGSQES